MRIQVLQHVLYEGPGQIEEWARARGHQIQTTRVFIEDPLPAVEDFDLLVVMGGPMGAYEDTVYPWMTREKQFLALAIESKKKILGICLGAQLLASVLGARVYPNAEKEIGWYPVDLDAANARNHPIRVIAPQSLVFHWHSDTFELPEGAVHLASSPACWNQAFAYGTHVLGLQFHLELQPGQIEALINHGAADLVPSRYVMDPREMLAQAAFHTPPLHATLAQMLDQLTLVA